MSIIYSVIVIIQGIYSWFICILYGMRKNDARNDVFWARHRKLDANHFWGIRYLIFYIFCFGWMSEMMEAAGLATSESGVDIARSCIRRSIFWLLEIWRIFHEWVRYYCVFFHNHMKYHCDAYESVSMALNIVVSSLVFTMHFLPTEFLSHLPRPFFTHRFSPRSLSPCLSNASLFLLSCPRH